MDFIPITDENDAWIDRIYAGDEEQYWVHYNRYWHDNSLAHDDIECRLICVPEHADPVGIIAYGRHYTDEGLTKPVAGVYEVIHTVIDKPRQRRGYGRRATLMAIERLRQRPDCASIVIAHNPENTGARRLYESLGFVAFGRNYDGDPLMRLVPS